MPISFGISQRRVSLYCNLTWRGCQRCLIRDWTSSGKQQRQTEAAAVAKMVIEPKLWFEVVKMGAFTNRYEGFGGKKCGYIGTSILTWFWHFSVWMHWTIESRVSRHDFAFIASLNDEQSKFRAKRRRVATGRPKLCWKLAYLVVLNGFGCDALGICVMDPWNSPNSLQSFVVSKRWNRTRLVGFNFLQHQKPIMKSQLFVVSNLVFSIFDSIDSSKHQGSTGNMCVYWTWILDW